jgi:hypothetical protein
MSEEEARATSQVLTTAVAASVVKALKQKRALVKGRLTRFKQYVDTMEINESSIKQRLSRHEGFFSEFEQMQAKIESYDGDPDFDKERLIAVPEPIPIQREGERTVRFRHPTQ